MAAMHAGRQTFSPETTSNFGLRFVEYCTLLGYAAIQEEEYRQTICRQVRDVEIAARFVTTPRVGNRRYFGFLDLRAFEARPITGDELSVNFAGFSDATSGWTAYVVDHLPIAPIGSKLGGILCPRHRWVFPRRLNVEGQAAHAQWLGRALRAASTHLNTVRPTGPRTTGIGFTWLQRLNLLHRGRVARSPDRRLPPMPPSTTGPKIIAPCAPTTTATVFVAASAAHHRSTARHT
ncbi:MAG: hypothetical protein M1826_001073 [Phylliscum demangeonii]|nr:MAG: hypothetical protein M1826_001073 [Phylliscum demangeonii]